MAKTNQQFKETISTVKSTAKKNQQLKNLYNKLNGQNKTMAKHSVHLILRLKQIILRLKQINS